jgi:hypothetical protein
MKTIALVCPATVGHHRTYLRFFTRALLDLHCTVVAFTPEAADFTQWPPASSRRVQPAAHFGAPLFESIPCSRAALHPV